MEIRKGSISHLILLILEKSIDGYARVEDFAYHPHRYAYGNPSTLKKSSLAAAIRRLRERGFIEKDIASDKVIVKLTSLGREVLGEEVDSKDWDGKWRIVIFDIPEKYKRIRDLFRRKLKVWGFKLWQQSVWITKKDVSQRLNKLIQELEIQNWVAIIESDNPVFSNIHLRGR